MTREPVYVEVERVNGDVEEGVMVVEVRWGPGFASTMLDEPIRLGPGDKLTVSGMAVYASDD